MLQLKSILHNRAVFYVDISHIFSCLNHQRQIFVTQTETFSFYIYIYTYTLYNCKSIILNYFNLSWATTLSRWRDLRVPVTLGAQLSGA